MLEIRGLTKTYPTGVRALAGVELTVPPGLYGLLGPNGAGKSTLLRTIATLQAPDAGEVRLDGRDAFADPNAMRRRLGYLPQDHGVYPGVSALELLDHLAVLKGLGGKAARRGQITTLLERTNLARDAKKPVASFSGGMRRRFGIAQALLGDPRLVIVDEPTAGLDPEERRRFHDLLLEVAERRIVLLSTHLVAEVHELCPRVAILAAGRIVADGEPGALIAALRGRLWQRAVERSEVARLAKELPLLSSRLHRGRTEVLVEAASAPAPGFELREPDLEDAYFAALANANRRPTAEGPRHAA